MAKTLLLCDCLGSQTLDPKGIAAATGLGCSRVHTALCQHQGEQAAKAIAAGEVIVACQQERAFFEDLAEDLGVEAPGFVDLRDRAGWGEGEAMPKMAALAAEAMLDAPTPKSLDVVSEGTCLILGGAEVALDTAAALSDALAVTVLLTDAADLPVDRRFDVIHGQIRQATGTLGAFRLRIDGLRQVQPGGRGALTFGPPRDGAVSDCDIILDLRGDTPLFPAPDKREGYLRADPRQPVAVARAAAEAAQMVGTFEKPLYVRLEPSICAHSRAEQVGCSKCLDICPTGAITPAGDHVSIDPMICAGCGACSALCPSGAISYDAPPVATVFRRLDVLSKTYRKAGGQDPRLLVHDDDHGAEMIRMAARFGRGLPADVIPLEVGALAGFGHAEMLAALSCGFAAVDILLSPRTERATPEGEAALANAIAGAAPVTLLDMADPDALCANLYDAAPATALASPVLPIGTRRQVTRVAAKALRGAGEVVDLPAAAPYGAVLVDTDACTLCLSCVSLCPSGALGDNEDKPQLLFQEDACLQCGLCATICPEDAITLKPQLNLTDAAMSQQILNEEEPFACVECGGLFGVKSAIEAVTEKLASHSMYANPGALRMIQMCDKCRVNAQFHSTDNPFAQGTPRRPRTTDDYLNDGPSKRRDH